MTRYCYKYKRLKNSMFNSIHKHLVLVLEVMLRVALFSVFWYLESVAPFHRVIKPEELWLYKNPMKPYSTVSTPVLMVVALGIPSSFIITHYLSTRSYLDLQQGFLGLSLSAALNAVVSNLLKVAVGRPRPDYYYRCFPDGVMTSDLHCLGDPDKLIDGRKSFPSGHTSWMFACFGFLSLYLMGKLQCFRSSGRGEGWRLMAALIPLMAATYVGLSRFQDCRHHWDDILSGGVIGSIIAMLCYFHTYPPPWSPSGHAPHITAGSNSVPSYIVPGNGDGDDCELALSSISGSKHSNRKV